MNLTWSTAHTGGACCMRFQGTKKLPDEDQELNDLVANTVKYVLKENKHARI